MASAEDGNVFKAVGEAFARYERPEKYPSFQCDCSAIDMEMKELLDAAKGILADFKFCGSGKFSPDELRFLLDIETYGISYAVNRRQISKDDMLLRLAGISERIGEVLVEKLLSKPVSRQLYTNNIMILPVESGKTVKFTLRAKRLESIKTNQGNLHYSRRGQIVQMHKGKHYRLLYSNHAIKRLYLRFSPNGQVGYASNCHIYKLLEEGGRFDTFTMDQGNGKRQYYARLYAPIADDFTAVSCSSVMEEYDAEKKYLILLGYYPLGIARHGKKGYACAETFLTPGMNGTPEHRYMMGDADIDNQERKKLLDSLDRSSTYEKVLKNRDFYAFEQFHKNVTPMFIEDDGSYFEP
ncbi:MAG: hypothetical protein AB7F23_02605 [Phycisphaerae bacterium]